MFYNYNLKFGPNFSGATENARLELSAPSKMQGWKMQAGNMCTMFGGDIFQSRIFSAPISAYVRL